MTSSRDPRQFHVERTADPTVLRWVFHHPALDPVMPGTRTPPYDRPLGALVADGLITRIAVGGGDLRVQVTDSAAWGPLAAVVQGSLLTELDVLDRSRTHWLTDSTDTSCRPPSIAELQHIVDRAAGSAMVGHGGAMAVVAVEQSTVKLRPEGACHGCGQISSTLLDVIGPAIGAIYPELAIKVDS